MTTTKIAVSLDRNLLAELDRLVAQHVFPNRSRAIQAAVEDKLTGLRRTRLARECAKLDAQEERSLAEEGMGTELTAWPEY
jgi:metal-responsive CopG/Arc/MetJ family transcriptional regulator